MHTVLSVCQQLFFCIVEVGNRAAEGFATFRLVSSRNCVAKEIGCQFVDPFSFDIASQM